MRSVPHRVVCLLGLDEESFPRKAPRDGDDLMLAEPRIGERDPRSEDRQLLLDAVLAARERLVVTYTGNDERTNAVRPPAVPLGELIDVAGPTSSPATRCSRSTRATSTRERAPLVRRDDARAAPGPCAGRVERAALPARPLPPLDEDVIELEELVRFADHPVRRFLRRRLGVEVRDFNEEVADGLTSSSTPSSSGGSATGCCGRGWPASAPAEARAAEQRRGALPPGRSASRCWTRSPPRVEAIVAAAGDEPAALRRGRVELPDGRPLRGTVPDVCGTTVRTVVYSNLAAKHRIHAWVRLLALTRRPTPARPGRADRRAPRPAGGVRDDRAAGPGGGAGRPGRRWSRSTSAGCARRCRCRARRPRRWPRTATLAADKEWTSASTTPRREPRAPSTSARSAASSPTTSSTAMPELRGARPRACGTPLLTAR